MENVWLNSLPPNAITTWLGLQAEFLTNFFSVAHDASSSKANIELCSKAQRVFLPSVGMVQGTFKGVSASRFRECAEQ